MLGLTLAASARGGNDVQSAHPCLLDRLDSYDATISARATTPGQRLLSDWDFTPVPLAHHLSPGPERPILLAHPAGFRPLPGHAYLRKGFAPAPVPRPAMASEIMCSHRSTTPLADWRALV